MRKFESLFVLFILIPFLATSQQVTLEGYVFETGNRGYLNMATVTIMDNETKALRGETQSDLNGKFEFKLTAGKEYLIRVNKKPFESVEQVISTKDKQPGEKLFVKFEMKRMPGYLFEVTLAPSRSDDEMVVDAITGAWIEVYNNTTEKEKISLVDHPSHTFSCRFEQGNHYTILIRKEGFFNKRLEAYVNVKGCILCFDGVGEVKPGVSDVLTEGLEMGTLLANVEMQPIQLNKTIEIENIYYDLNSARIKSTGRKELDQLAVLLKDNKKILIEIGSHTDSRGDDKSNQRLSLKRAQGVVKYLIDSDIAKERLIAKGYGESKLRNKCKNGVECSERRHQQNRRTELKVIGFVHKNLEDNRSLREMKEEEALEKMLAQLGDSEIKINPGDELPEDLKKQLEQDDLKLISKPFDQNPPVVRKKMKLSKQEPPLKEQKKVMVPIKEETKIEKQESINKKANLKVKPKRNSIPKAEQRQTTTPIKETKEKKETFGNDFSDDEFQNEDNRPKLVPDREVNTLANIRKPTKLATSYSGYRVEVIKSIYELPLSHDLFSRHGNIVLEETKQGNYAYLIGDFKWEEDAQEFMQNILSLRYPNAKVIKYIRGRRVTK